MATTVKDRQPGKHDPFIDAQLARAERRVRQIDLAAGLLALAASALAFVAAVALLDRALTLSAFARLVALLAYLAAAGTFAAYAVVRPLRWKVNPRYAARLLEGTLEGDRNHLVNWVDLRGQKLPAVIRSALGQRTAKDLGEADPERAVSPARAYAAGAALVVALSGCVALAFAFGLAQFEALASRAVVPFAGPVPTRTQVAVVRPEGGDAVVTIGQPLAVVAKVTGRVPDARGRDAPCLLYRHDPDEPYRQRYLSPDEAGGEWSATVAPNDVGEGFWYKVTAGDAQTPEYRVTTRAAPLVRYFRVVYRHRPYVGQADRVDGSRKLEGLEGTEAVVSVWANRAVASGRLAFDGPGTFDAVRPQPSEVKASLVPEEPDLLRFVVPLWKSCKYRIEYVTKEGEKYAPAEAYDVVVTPDHLPTASLSEPGKDVTLPPDGHLELAGEARDDLGLARVELSLTLDGRPLSPLPYLADKLGKAGLGTPRAVAYRQVLELPKLLDADGKKVELKAGMVVEYRLSAADACDFRAPPQWGRSDPAYKVTVAEEKRPDEAARKKELDDARQRQQEQARAEEERLKQEKAEQDARRDKEQKQAEQEQKKGDKGEGKPDQPKPDDPGRQEKDERLQKQADQIRQEIDGKGEGKEAGPDDKGEGKGEGGKGEGEGKAGGGKASEGKDGDGAAKGGDGKAGDGKPPPKQDGKPGEGKGSGVSDGKEKGERTPQGDRPDAPSKGEAKRPEVEGRPGGEARPGEESKGQKPSLPRRPDEKGGEAKPGGKDGDDRPGRGKSPDAGEGKDKAGEGRPGNEPRDAKPMDVKQTAQKLQDADPDRRQKAARDLKQMAQNARDEQAKRDAKQAIEDGKAKGQLDQNGDAKGASEQSKRDAGGPDADGPGKAGDRGEDKRGQSKAGQAKGKEAGDPAGGSDDSRENSGGGGEASQPKKSQTPDEARASQLQLERFARRVDADALRRLKMSREDFERFLRDYEEMARRQARQRRPDEAVPGPSPGGKLPVGGGNQLSPTGEGKDDLRDEGRAKPPPGYRDAYNEMLRRLREQR